jgi:choline dehydrogenase-like flavoprotein
MFVEANDIDRSKIPVADICIIGSGAAGLAMAHSLIGSGKTVTVLEASRHNDVGVPPDEDGWRVRGGHAGRGARGAVSDPVGLVAGPRLRYRWARCPLAPVDGGPP